MRALLLFGAMAAVSCFWLATTAIAAEPERIEVRPKETEELFANPGMGWQTFHRFVVHDKELQGLPTSSAYYRFYWREIEPEKGKIDFEKLDGMLAFGRRHGQKLALRIMVMGSGEPSDCPDWLRAAGCKGQEALYGDKKVWIPDFSDPVFQEKHFALIRKLGERYDGHRDLDLVDIGTVGLWGEWHMSELKDAKTGEPIAMPSEAAQNAVIDAYVDAFPKTPKVVLIGSDVGLARAAKEGLGWRADCLGDLGMFTPNWNHMEDYYPKQVEKFGAGDAWKKAPVAFESCGDMRDWAKEGWTIGDILDYALAQHASYLNNKSAPLPDGARPEIERFLRKLGYRLVVRRLEHDATAEAGSKFPVTIEWENVGVAPPYGDYRVAIRLRPLAHAQAKSAFLASDESIRGWLPGKRSSEYSFELPADLRRGQYELALALVEAETLNPVVRLAIEGRDASGWYPLSRIEVGRE